MLAHQCFQHVTQSGKCLHRFTSQNPSSTFDLSIYITKWGSSFSKRSCTLSARSTMEYWVSISSYRLANVLLFIAMLLYIHSTQISISFTFKHENMKIEQKIDSSPSWVLGTVWCLFENLEIIINSSFTIERNKNIFYICLFMYPHGFSFDLRVISLSPSLCNANFYNKILTKNIVCVCATVCVCNVCCVYIMNIN